MTRLLIDGQRAKTFRGLDITDPKLEGVRVIRSTGIVLDGLTVHDCLLAGILDYGASDLTIIRCTVRGNGRKNVPDALGKDTRGSGVQIQGRQTVVEYCDITDNGSDDTFEHGIYASIAAREYLIHDNVVRGNSASGIKASGTGSIIENTVSGSVRGLVYADDADGQVIVKGNKVSATLYAILVTSTCDLSRFESDENTFAKGSRFGYKGQSLDLAGWQRKTGLDKHSEVAA